MNEQAQRLTDRIVELEREISSLKYAMAQACRYAEKAASWLGKDD